ADRLFAKGYNVHARDDDGMTPLHHGALNALDVPILKLLLDAGADPNSPVADPQPDGRKRFDKTPLHFATTGPNPDVTVPYLISRGADPTIEDPATRETAQEWAIRRRIQLPSKPVNVVRTRKQGQQPR